MHRRSYRLAGMVTALMTVLGLGARAARAEQFVLVDDTFTFTKADADKSQSHHFVNTVMQPAANWLMPVDYRNGTVHIRTEVIEKAPGGEITQWSICYFGSGDSYGCDESNPYTQAGVVQPEREVAMTSWWQNETIDWSKGIKQMAFVMKDKDESDGHTFKRPDPEHFFPTKVRITIIQVSKGSKYDPALAGFGPAGAVDGGSAVDAGPVIDASPVVDAAPEPDPGASLPDAASSVGTGGVAGIGGSGGGSGEGGTGPGSTGGMAGAPASGGSTGGSLPSNPGAGGGSGSAQTGGHGGSRSSGSASSSPGCAIVSAGAVGPVGFATLVLGLALLARRRRR